MILRLTASILFLLAALSCTPSKKNFTGNGASGDQSGINQGGPSPADSAANETPDPAAEEEQEAEEQPTEEDALAQHPQGPDSLKVICARPGQDRVRQVFCAPNPPNITSLVDLQTAMGVQIGGGGGFTFTGHSSSLVARFTSAINPRGIFFVGEGAPDYVAMGFVRGEQFAELIARDPQSGELAFFLLQFYQACNVDHSCGNADLLTPAVESNWTGYSIYEDVDLENTIVDCRHCHQPNGPGTPKILRMQELQNPWTHFFRDNTSGGPSLIADYFAAHGTDETYAGVPAAIIPESDPADLEDFVRAGGFDAQPNEFETRSIEDEVQASSPNQPEDNSAPGTSATWQAQYEATIRGETIPIPYHDVKVSDPAKLATMTKAYQDYKAGLLPKEQFPDIREVFIDSKIHEMGFAPAPGLTGREIIVQSCAQCHNSKLNQAISRAKFDVDLSKMSREEKDKAIERIMLPAEHLLAMPPKRFRTLREEDKLKAIEELKK